MAGDYPKSSAHEDKDDGDPYYDPFSEEELLNLLYSPNANSMDLAFTENPLPPLPSPPPPPPVTTATMDINDTGLLQQLSLSIPNCDTNDFLASPLDEDLLLPWDMFDLPTDYLNDINMLGEIGNDNGINVAETGTLVVIGNDNGINVGETGTLEVIGNDNGYNVGETGRLEASNRTFVENGVNFETGGSSMPVPPIIPTISDGISLCTCCNLLRTLVHTNGQEMMRLDIHGGIGYFCHAILETRPLDGSTEPQYQTIYLKDLSMEDVKNFIQDYCAARAAGGFGVAQDTNADFYQAMNAFSIDNQSLMWPLPRCDDVPMALAMPDQALNVPSVPLYVGLRDGPPVSKVRQRRRTPLAVQRERTGKLKLKDISMHFHLPIEEAARKMSLCPTVVKKICRRGGLYRWPHRKIKSLLRKITALRSALDTTTGVQARARVEEEIERLEKQVSEICREALKNA